MSLLRSANGSEVLSAEACCMGIREGRIASCVDYVEVAVDKLEACPCTRMVALGWGSGVDTTGCIYDERQKYTVGRLHRSTSTFPI